jgi:hypothetical protein
MDALMKNINKWEKTGNPAVDMVAECVYQARAKKKPLRNIHLKPSVYIMFIDYLCRKVGEHLILSPTGEVIAPIEFDGISILKGSNYQQNILQWDLWPMLDKQVKVYQETQKDTGSFPEHLSQVN